MELAAKLGIPCPETLLPSSIAEVDAGVEKLGMPCVVKLRRGSGSAGVLIAHTAAEVAEFVEARQDKSDWLILQAYRPGALVGVAAVCQQGRLIASQSFRAEDRHLIGGSVPYVTSADGPKISERIAAIVEALHWEGPLDFDFLEAEGGELLLIELNPRFSGTTTLPYRIGLDMPRMLVDCAFGRTANPNTANVSAGQRFRTGLEYELIWWGRDHIRRTFELVANWLNPSVLYIPRWSDPALLFGQVRSAAKAIVRFHRSGG